MGRADGKLGRAETTAEGEGAGRKGEGRKEPLGTNRVMAVQPPPLRHDAYRA